MKDILKKAKKEMKMSGLISTAISKELIEEVERLRKLEKNRKKNVIDLSFITDSTLKGRLNTLFFDSGIKYKN